MRRKGSDRAPPRQRLQADTPQTRQIQIPMPPSLHKHLGALRAGPVPPPPGDLQRRLADALQPMPPNPLQNFSPSGHNEQSRPIRDSWMAPGKVVIEDGLENFPPLAGKCAAQNAATSAGGRDTAIGSIFRTSSASGNSAYCTTSSGHRRLSSASAEGMECASSRAR